MNVIPIIQLRSYIEAAAGVSIREEAKESSILQNRTDFVVQDALDDVAFSGLKSSADVAGGKDEVAKGVH